MLVSGRVLFITLAELTIWESNVLRSSPLEVDGWDDPRFPTAPRLVGSSSEGGTHFGKYLENLEGFPVHNSALFGVVI